MKRLLLLGALTVIVLATTAVAAPTSTHTVRGTVIAKDRLHRGLVVALPGGAVKTVKAPTAFGRTGVGRTVVIRYADLAGALPVALGVSLRGHTRHAVVQGTVVRLVKLSAVINAGGTALRVRLTAMKPKRRLASLGSSTPSAVSVGDTVEVQVAIGSDGILTGSAAVVGATTGPQVGSEGTMEVRGKVGQGLVQPSSSAPGWITIETSAATVTCVIPVGAQLNVTPGDMIELECDLVGKDWTVRVAHGEGEQSGGGGDDSSEVTVRGVLSFPADGMAMVTPPSPGSPVTCAIPTSALTEVKAKFAAGDVVKMECVTIGNVPTLKKIRKNAGSAGEPNGANNDDNGDNNDNHGDD